MPSPRPLALAALLASGLFLSATGAEACSCLRAESAAAQMADAELVFIGRVERTAAPGVDGMTKTRFVALRTLKGEHQDSRTIEHHTVSATCGMTYEADQYVIVLAGAEGGRLSTSLCQQPMFDWSDYLKAGDAPPQQTAMATSPINCATARA